MRLLVSPVKTGILRWLAWKGGLWSNDIKSKVKTLFIKSNNIKGKPGKLKW